MISKIERKRILIFVAITYGSSIVVAIAIFLNGGLFSRYPTTETPLAKVLLIWLMFTPAISNVLTRGFTGEGWPNTLLRSNIRHGWPYYLAALTFPVLAIVGGGAIYYLLFPSRFDPSMTYAREELRMIAAGGATNP